MSLAQLHKNFASLAPAKQGQAVAWLAAFRLATIGPLTIHELSLAVYGMYTNATKVRMTNSVLGRLVGRKVLVAGTPKGQRKSFVRDNSQALVDVLETGKGKRVYALNKRGALFVEQQTGLRSTVEQAAGGAISFNAWNGKARDMTTLVEHSTKDHTVLARGYLALRAAQADGILAVVGEPALRRGMCPAISLESMKHPARVPDGAIFQRNAEGVETLEIVEAEFTKKGHAAAVKAFEKFCLGLASSYWVQNRLCQALLTYVVPADEADEFKRNLAAAFGRWADPTLSPKPLRDAQGNVVAGRFVEQRDEQGNPIAGLYEEDTGPSATRQNGLKTSIKVGRSQLAHEVAALTRVIRFVPARVTPQGCVACDFDYETLEQYLVRTGKTLDALAANSLTYVPLMSKRGRQSMAPRRAIAAEKRATKAAANGRTEVPAATSAVVAPPVVVAVATAPVAAKARPVAPEWGRFGSKELTKLAHALTSDEAMATVCDSVELDLELGNGVILVADVARVLYAVLKIQAKDEKQEGQFLFHLGIYATAALTALAEVGRAIVFETKTLASGLTVPTSFNVSTY